jgi:hypothetical protein
VGKKKTLNKAFITFNSLPHNHIPRRAENKCAFCAAAMLWRKVLRTVNISWICTGLKGHAEWRAFQLLLQSSGSGVSPVTVTEPPSHHAAMRSTTVIGRNCCPLWKLNLYLCNGDRLVTWSTVQPWGSELWSHKITSHFTRVAVRYQLPPRLPASQFIACAWISGVTNLWHPGNEPRPLKPREMGWRCEE